MVFGLISVSGCGDDGGTKTTAKPASKPAASAPSASAPSQTAATTPSVPETRSPEELVAGGRAVYAANCIACHNMNPAQDGALGPAVAGSSLALLEARVLRGEYPEGHTPARPSKIMVPLPHLEPKLPELAAYLASAK